MSIWLIARNTFREATRDRLLVGVFVAGLLLFVATQVLSPLALGEGRRLIVDLGLSGISLLGLLMVLLVATSLVAKEIERRTIFNLLSRPIRRSSYLIGKWAGLCGALWTVAAGLGLALVVLLALRGERGLALPVMQGVYFASLELGVITAVAVLFSALSTPVLSSLYTLGFFLVGSWSYDLRAFAQGFPPGLRQSIEALACVVPNLPVFNTRSLAAAGQLASGAQVGVASLYAVTYIGCVLALAAAAFETRDFK
jgi:ABC-type transport system involved in multi-copper enzyme maturation permease subunit